MWVVQPRKWILNFNSNVILITWNLIPYVAGGYQMNNIALKLRHILVYTNRCVYCIWPNFVSYNWIWPVWLNKLLFNFILGKQLCFKLSKIVIWSYMELKLFCGFFFFFFAILKKCVWISSTLHCSEFKFHIRVYSEVLSSWSYPGGSPVEAINIIILYLSIEICICTSKYVYIS